MDYTIKTTFGEIIDKITILRIKLKKIENSVEKEKFANEYNKLTISHIKINDIVYLQIGNVNTEAELITMEKDLCSFKLSKPSCIYDDTLILICSKVLNDILRIVGYGNLISNKSKIINI